ncbi:MAG: L,D-transpeptidase family protein [Alphaproteobacteria bacterium]|nr:L,D-transpeptidase family protein [Alphaproteobacteria bacterium]
MFVLRKLALCYLVSVSAFGLAAGLRAWPGAADNAVRIARDDIWRPTVQMAMEASHHLLDPPASDVRVVLALKPPGAAGGLGFDERTTAHVELPQIERPALIDVPPQVQLTLDVPVVIVPDLPTIALPPPPQKRASPARPVAEEPPLPPMPKTGALPRTQAQLDSPDPTLTPEQARARAHLAATLTPEMREHFGLVIFVSKAAKGPLAQRAYIFKQNHGALSLLYDWAASTGREKQERDAQGDRSFTATPAGFYQFDPERMFRQYHSTNWDQDMPNAMFFNWQREGLQTGLAIHAATGDDVAKLGARASAGCVHLSPENARTLFNLVKAEYRGQVPRFAIDGNDTMSTKGKFSRRPDGSLRMAEGYRVLIDIENYSGAEGSDEVALL